MLSEIARTVLEFLGDIQVREKMQCISPAATIGFKITRIRTCSRRFPFIGCTECHRVYITGFTPIYIDVVRKLPMSVEGMLLVGLPYFEMGIDGEFEKIKNHNDLVKHMDKVFVRMSSHL